MSEAPIRVAVVGTGNRGGEAYGFWLLDHPERVRVVAVADPLASRRRAFAERGASEYERWEDLAVVLGPADVDVDAIVIALPDRLHVDATCAFVGLGRPILLEKPAAPDRDGLARLAGVVQASGTPVAIAHVLRFTVFWRAVSRLVRSGALGRLVTVEVRENIGFWHFAHSYVRGNWKNSGTSSPMVLAKTCHDLDLIRWLVGERPISASSVGSLLYFRPENAPGDAPAFCVQGCPASESCSFHAPRYYVEALAGHHGMPVRLLTEDTTPAGRLAALAHSDYGRCVFSSGNDVVDHQQTVFDFPSGTTASLTASAFTGENTRHLCITGTGGQLIGHMDDGRLEVDLFSPTAVLPELGGARIDVRRREPMGHPSYLIDVDPPDSPEDGRGHGGGDAGLMEAFFDAVESGEWDESLSFTTALDSHWMAFAAEEARIDGRRVPITDLLDTGGTTP